MTENQLNYLASLGLIFWGRRPLQEELVPISRSTEQAQTSARLNEEVRIQTKRQASKAKQAELAPKELNNQPPPNRASAKITDLQDLVSFRYEALVIPPVIVLYEITGELELPPQQRELLDSMLSRCGLKGSPSVRSLPWPPPFSLDEENDQAEQAYLGFLTSLVENNECKWLILMGESKLSLPAINIIKLDSLGLLVQEPKRRIKAWEELAPLRDSIN